MWIPSVLFSEWVEVIHLDFNRGNVDEYNQPIPLKTVNKTLSEVIPYDNTYNRKLLGITNSTAFRVYLPSTIKVDGDDIIGIDGKAFKISRKDDFNCIRNMPLHIIVEYTGQTVDEYVNIKATQ